MDGAFKAPLKSSQHTYEPEESKTPVKFVSLKDEDDEASVFSISENIKHMLLDDNASTTAKGSSSTHNDKT